MVLQTEDSAIGFDESLLDHAAAAARASGRFRQEVIGGRGIASGDFIQDPIKRKLGVVIARLAGCDRLLRAANRIGADGEKFDSHIRSPSILIEDALNFT